MNCISNTGSEENNFEKFSEIQSTCGSSWLWSHFSWKLCLYKYKKKYISNSV